MHLTKRIDGEVLIGPTALLAGPATRTAADGATADVVSTLSWPGTYAWPGASGARASTRPATCCRVVVVAARRRAGADPRDVLPGFAGVRAQAVGRDGR